MFLIKISMLLKLLIVLSLFSTIKTVVYRDLVNLPLKIPKGSAVINATLTDVKGSKKYSMQELISASGPTITGKTVISSDTDSYTVHYNAASDTGVDSKERLVIHGSECLLLIFEKNKLPGIYKLLINTILLMGPSILYRLDHSSIIWKTDDSRFTNVRGSMMKSATAEIGKKVRIAYYYKHFFDDQTGINNPSRIEFTGLLPPKENLILDIYFKSESEVDQFVNEVQPLPGIGCPHYLSGMKGLPSLKAFHLHYTMYEYIEGSITSKSINQVYAAQFFDFLRLKTTINGGQTETINDYRFGASFQFSPNTGYQSLAVDSNSPGLNMDNLFSLSSLFMLDGAFKYLGKLNLKHRDGIAVEAWESVQYNVNINGKTVDKAVITQYFAQSKSHIFWEYTLVSTKISIYHYDQNKQVYSWSDGITRDYMDFQEARSGESILSLTNKVGYWHSGETLVLNFILECSDFDNSQDSCLKHTEGRVTYLKGDFLYFILLGQPVSILRISDIQYRFTDTKVEMEVKFLDLVDLKYIFASKFMSVSLETIDKMKTTKAATEDDCIKKLTNYHEPIKAVIYQSLNNVCGYLTNLEDLKEDLQSGHAASVYRFPLHNLNRVKQELPLNEIHDAYLKDVGRAYSLFDGKSSISFKLIDVIDRTEKATGLNRDIISQLRWDAKLKFEDQLTVSEPDAKTFSDCYRNCHDSKTVSCNILSFCDTDKGDKPDCRVSSLQSSDVINKDLHIENDLKCKIFSLNVLKDYSKVVNRKLRNPTSVAFEKGLNSCAESCHGSSDCISFQYCRGSCSFGSFFTDADSQYDEQCTIYFPKAFEKYQKTGNKIVSEVMHTEMNLNFEQCAALCDGWSDGETECKSFNYCPKSRTESSCSLTKFSVKSSGAKTIEGGDCSNYELKEESGGKKNRESSSTEVINKGTSGSGAFGIIMLFLFVGALLGFLVPLGYKKVKQVRDSSKVQTTFGWTRQINVEPSIEQ